ncbi:MAG: hypothetical protein PVF96_08535 [Candidatus Bathyarchaeota archaeon]|jgi:hypothetical protein
MDKLRNKLGITVKSIEKINEFILRKDNPLVNDLLTVIEKYGGVTEINQKAHEASKLNNLIARLEKENPKYLEDLNWLIDQKDNGAFIDISDYRKKVLGSKVESLEFDDSFAVTLEVSGCNFFPWFIEEAKQSIAQQDLMPARYIRVRSMNEQKEDGAILALTAAMEIIGASYVQTLDTKGTMLGINDQPINVHLGGPDTITGYFGGVGVPNRYALEWVDEFLYYYTKYGVRQVLNVNSGTVMLGYLLYKLGIDIKFKISVFLGNDNPYACLWTLLAAGLFSRKDGTTPLVGFNLSNAVDNETIELSAFIRQSLDLENAVRIEHHIVETYKSIVRQPYDRLDELLDIAGRVRNISAKHEGAFPETEAIREHPSDILEYFIPKKEIIKTGLMPKLLFNYLDKHNSVNKTAKALTERGVPVIAANNLHRE